MLKFDPKAMSFVFLASSFLSNFGHTEVKNAKMLKFDPKSTSFMFLACSFLSNFGHTEVKKMQKC
jgi:hypothetical protein